MKLSVMGAALLIGGVMVSACGGPGEDPAETATTPPAETGMAESVAGPETETASETEASAQYAGFPEPYASADADRGKRVWLQCQTCHTINEGGQTILGPNLHGVFGREAGSLDTFAYSAALQEADFSWTPEQLDEWLARPRDFLPGNNMNFAGINRPDDRTAVIAYIMAESGYSPE